MKLLVMGGDAAGDALAKLLTGDGIDAVRGDGDAARPDAVVILVAPSRAGRPLASLTDGEWTAAFAEPLRQARCQLQQAGSLLGEGGRVLMLAGTGGMSGVGDVAACAVEEGARALAKSVALAWQPRSIGLSFVAFADGALGAREHLAATVAPTVRAVLAAPPAISGSTIVADGGVLLVP